jgi:hypothetical protein
MPIEFNLKLNPLCQTRSNALLVSQKTILTSLPESMACAKILYKYVNWLTVESPETKPNCRDVIMLLDLRKLNVCLSIILSKTLLTVLITDMGL